RRGDVVEIPLGTEVQVVEIEVFDRKDPPLDSAVVRVLGGPLKGTKLWVADYEITRMLPNPAYGARARDLLRAARNLEVAGKARGAVDFYRQVVKEFRGLPEADQAAVRIKALGGRVPDVSESVAPQLADRTPRPPVTGGGERLLDPAAPASHPSKLLLT